MASESIVVFAQFQSAVDEGFWHRFSSLKLNKLGIDDSPIPITGFYHFFFALYSSFLFHLLIRIQVLITIFFFFFGNSLIDFCICEGFNVSSDHSMII